MGTYYAWMPIGGAAFTDGDGQFHPGWGEYEYSPTKMSAEDAAPFKEDLVLDVTGLTYGAPSGIYNHQVITFAGQAYEGLFSPPEEIAGWAAYSQSDASYPGEHYENIDIDGYVGGYTQAARLRGLLVEYVSAVEVGSVVPGAPYTDSPRMRLFQSGSDAASAVVTLHIDSNYTTPYLGLESFKVYATFHTPGRDTPPPEPPAFWTALLNAREIV